MLKDYLIQLASDAPAPGGGAAAALTAAQGVALCAMVLRISQGRADDIAAVEQLSAEFQKFAAPDGEAFAGVLAAQKLPKQTPEELQVRTSSLAAALKRAAAVPLEVMLKIYGAAPLLQSTYVQSKPSVLSDVGVAVELLEGAPKASAFNVYANLKYIKDKDFNLHARQEVMRLTEQFAEALGPMRLSLAGKFK